MKRLTLDRLLRRLTSPRSWQKSTRRIFLLALPLAVPLWLLALIATGVLTFLKGSSRPFVALWNDPPIRASSRYNAYRYAGSKRGRLDLSAFIAAPAGKGYAVATARPAPKQEPRMLILCRFGRHEAADDGIWNEGHHFSRCIRCERDIVRAADGEWASVPRGYRIAWKARTASDVDWKTLETARQNITRIGARQESALSTLPMET